jgi:hypothetical protein
MSAPEKVLTDGELLAAVTEARVGFHQRAYHRGPVSARTVLLGDEETRNAFQSCCCPTAPESGTAAHCPVLVSAAPLTASTPSDTA